MGLRAKLADDRGGVAIMAAVAGALICVTAAFAVDLGSMVLKGREVQGAADLSALAAAQTLSQPLSHTQTAARDIAGANLSDLAGTQVEVGTYTPDRRLKPAQRFGPTQGVHANAARVTLTAPAPLYFGRWIVGRDSVTVSRSATAAVPADPPAAMFSIGSRLAGVDGGLANALLSSLLGSQVSLTAMDYRSLADARINLLQFSDALAAEVGVTAGDYDALLAHEARTGQVLKALEVVAGSGAKSVLGKLTRLPANAVLKLDQLIGVDADARQGLGRGLDAQVSAMDLLMATLQTANQDRQLALDVGARTGLADLDIMLAIGERPNRSPWLTVTGSGDLIIRTVQTRLYLKATALDKVPLVGLLADVKVPILIEAASAEARLKDIQCEGTARVVIEARPGVARVRLGEIDEKRLRDFKSELKVKPATLVRILLITIEGSADIQIADLNWSELRFSGSEIGSPTPKSVRSKGFVNGLIVTLLRDTRLTALGIPLHLVTQLLAGILAPLGPVLDAVVQPLLELLGVRLGEADVWVHGVRCPNQGGVPQLVG